MKRVLTALVLIPIVLLVVFKAPIWLFSLVVGLFAVLACWEFLTITAISGVVKYTAIVLAMLFYLGVAVLVPGNPQTHLDGPALLAAFSPAIGPFIFLVLAFRYENLSFGLRDAGLSTLMFPYIVFSLGSLIAVRQIAFGIGWFFILLLFAIVWSGDIFAYYVGKNFGRHKLAPRISPGKSWEGAIASIVGAGVIAVLLVQSGPGIQSGLAKLSIVHAPSAGEPTSAVDILSPAPIWVTLSIAIFLNLAAQLGDLAESMIKRAVGVKDSGTLFPGHGGVLDRIDALLFAAPLAAILFMSLQHYFFALK
jgi:phosphatidate cytidylyltransferase